VETGWAYFACCVNECFSPPIRHNLQGGNVDEYTKRFLAHVARAETLDEQQQVNMPT
jgi:hypothetical protein